MNIARRETNRGSQKDSTPVDVPPGATSTRVARHNIDTRRNTPTTLQYSAPDKERPTAIVALTTDVELRNALTDALSDQRVVFAETPAEVLRHAAQSECAVLITDYVRSRNLNRASFEQLTKQLKRLDPALVTIAVGTRDEGSSLVGLLSSGAVDRFMVMPLQIGPTRVAVRSALQQHRMHDSRRSVAPGEKAPASSAQIVSLHAAPTSEPASELRAVDRSIALAEPASPAVDTARVTADEAAEEIQTPQRRQAPIRPLPNSTLRFAITAVAIAVALALVVWTLQTQRQDVAPLRAIDRNLAAAQQAFDRGQYVAPPELSALHFYSAALALDPSNLVAQRGLEAVADRLAEQCRALIASGHLSQAQAVFDTLWRTQPSHPALPELETQLQRARDAVSTLSTQTSPDSYDNASPSPIRPAAEQEKVEQTSPAQTGKPAPTLTPAKLATVTKSATPPSKMDSIEKPATAEPNSNTPNRPTQQSPQSVRDAQAKELQRLIDQRMQAGQLIEPAEDSAAYYYTQLAALDADFVELGQLTKLLGRRLASEAQVAVYRKQPERAQSLLKQARGIGFSGTELLAAEAALQSLRTPEPAPAATTPAEPRPESQSEPQLIKYVPPEYPPQAHAHGIEGWVNVRFKVSGDGTVIDPEIDDGVLRSLFGRAALTAVRQWKYAPLPDGASGPDRPMSVRIEFNLKNAAQ